MAISAAVSLSAAELEMAARMQTHARAREGAGANCLGRDLNGMGKQNKPQLTRTLAWTINQKAGLATKRREKAQKLPEMFGCRSVLQFQNDILKQFADWLRAIVH